MYEESISMSSDIKINYFRYRNEKSVGEEHEIRLSQAYMVFMLEGNVTNTVNGEKITIHPGEALYLPEGTLRGREYQDTCVKYYSVFFSGGDERDTSLITTVFKYKNFPEILWSLSMIEKSYVSRYYNAAEDDRRCRLIFAMLLNFCADVSCRRSHSPYVERIIDYINNNYKSKLTIAEIAEHVHLNPAYCSTLFHEQTGETIGNFIKNFRLDLAKEELHRGKTVRETAESVGFSDPYNFSKWFHKNADMAPSEFRSLTSSRKRTTQKPDSK